VVARSAKDHVNRKENNKINQQNAVQACRGAAIPAQVFWEKIDFRYPVVPRQNSGRPENQ
jgi:hypothetical protein